MKFFISFLMVMSFINVAYADQAEYLNALQSCTPGSFQFMQDGTPVTFIIQGPKDTHCLVDTSAPGKQTLHCAYSKATVAMFVAQANAPHTPTKPGQDPLANMSPQEMQQAQTLMQECWINQ